MRAGVTLVYQECNAITPQNTVVSGLSTQVCTYCNTPQVRYAHQRTVMLQSAVLSGCALACLLRVRPNITFRLRRVDTLRGQRVVRWTLCPLCGALWECGSRTLYTHILSLRLVPAAEPWCKQLFSRQLPAATHRSRWLNPCRWRAMGQRSYGGCI